MSQFFLDDVSHQFPAVDELLWDFGGGWEFGDEGLGVRLL